MEELQSQKKNRGYKALGMLEVLLLVVMLGVSKVVAETSAGIIIFIGLIPSCIGYFLAKWYLKRSNPKRKFINFFIWASVLAWLIPVFGFLIAAMAFVFAQTKQERVNEFSVIAIGCFLLSITNWVGAMLLSEDKISILFFCSLLVAILVIHLVIWLVFSLKADRRKQNIEKDILKKKKRLNWKSFFSTNIAYFLVGSGSFVFATQIFVLQTKYRTRIEWGKVIGFELIIIGVLVLVHKLLSSKTNKN